MPDRATDPSAEVEARSVAPPVLVVMGVSGSGKSTVASLIATRLGAPFVDGDDLHAPESVARMQAGQPLDDAVRIPWLKRVADWIDARLAAGEGGVVACSALRRSYREAIVRGRAGVRVVYLEGSRGLIGERLAARRGHFMPARLLDSQFAALEPPDPDENPIVVSIDDPPDAIAEAVAVRLGVASAPSGRFATT